MDMNSLKQALKEVAATNVTKTVHKAAYPAISPTRPELSQAGRVVLITGGGTGIGFSMAQNFIRASVDTVIIVGRRQAVLETAASQLEAEAKRVGAKTSVVVRTCDVANIEDIGAMFDELAARGISVDVFVNNAVKFSDPKSLTELGADEIWSQMEANVKGPLYLTERFCAQNGGKQKFIVNLTSGVIHSFGHPAVAMRPAYTLTKMASTAYFQLLAQETPKEKVQVVTMHPGLVYNTMWEDMGVPEDCFEHADLSGGFAVWLASHEAAFLHGRTVWATWDVEELSSNAVSERMKEEFYFLRVSVAGLNEGMLA